MCKNVPLERRAKISGIVDIIVSTIGLVVSSIDVNNLLNEDGEEGALERSRTLTVLYITIAISAIKFIMGVILYSGAKRRNDRLCAQWLYVSGALWMIQVINFVIKLIIGTIVILSTIFTTLTILIRIAVMFVVFRFIQEIRDGRLPVSVNSSR